jgi:hypothetical protein
MAWMIMYEHGIGWLYGCHLVVWWLEVGKIKANFWWALTTNLTQHDSHGPDDQLKTIDYHHLSMSKDDGMYEHGIGWLYGCHLVGCWHRSWANHNQFFSSTDHKSDPAWLTWARWPHQYNSLSSSEHVKRWCHRWSWNWLALWMSSEVGCWHRS